MSEEDKDPNRMATFRLHLPEDVTKSDALRFDLSFRNVRITVIWRDSERQDLIDVIAKSGTEWFVERGHLELEVARQALQIDGDLSRLFPDDEIDEEVETGE